MIETSKETIKHVKLLKPEMIIDNYPTINTMKKCVKEYGTERLIYAIMFFASNPYENKEDEEYKKLVHYCNYLLKRLKKTKHKENSTIENIS